VKNDMTEATSYGVYRTVNGSKIRLGTVTHTVRGWRFTPNLSGRHSSRKAHATMEAALPRWLGYPGRCDIEPIVR
jgi:hypothetical protein